MWSLIFLSVSYHYIDSGRRLRVYIWWTNIVYLPQKKQKNERSKNNTPLVLIGLGCKITHSSFITPENWQHGFIKKKSSPPSYILNTAASGLAVVGVAPSSKIANITWFIKIIVQTNNMTFACLEASTRLIPTYWAIDLEKKLVKINLVTKHIRTKLGQFRPLYSSTELGVLCSRNSCSL